MSMPKPVPNQKARVRCTVDVVLLTTLLNKELNASGKVFNIVMEYKAAADSWMLAVEHFKGTHVTVDPESLAKHEDMAKLAQKIAQKLLAKMAQKPKPATIGDKQNDAV